MFVSVFVRRLRPGKTYQDVLAAWYPEQGFGIPTRGPFVSRNPADDREILVVAFVDLPDVASLEAGLSDVAAQEAVRHDRASTKSSSRRRCAGSTSSWMSSTSPPTRPSQEASPRPRGPGRGVGAEEPAGTKCRRRGDQKL